MYVLLPDILYTFRASLTSHFKYWFIKLGTILISKKILIIIVIFFKTLFAMAWELLQVLINLSENLSAENEWKEHLHCMRQNLNILKRHLQLRYKILYAQLTRTTEETLLILGIQTSFLAANDTTYMWERGMDTDLF